MQTIPLCLCGFMSPVELVLALTVPMLIGAFLIYLGFRRAKKRLVDKANPTFLDMAKIAAPFWIIGLVIAVYPIAQFVLGMLSAIFN